MDTHRAVLGVQHTQLSEDAHVCSLEANAALQQGDELLIVPPRLVELADLQCRDSIRGGSLAVAGPPSRWAFMRATTALTPTTHLHQVISVDDDVQAAQLRQLELTLFHASIAHLLPGAWRVGLQQRHRAPTRGTVNRNACTRERPGCRWSQWLANTAWGQRRTRAWQQRQIKVTCLACGVHCGLELMQPDKRGGEAAIIGNAGIDEARRFIQPFLKAPARSTKERRGN